MKTFLSYLFLSNTINSNFPNSNNLNKFIIRKCQICDDELFQKNSLPKKLSNGE